MRKVILDVIPITQENLALLNFSRFAAHKKALPKCEYKLSNARQISLYRPQCKKVPPLEKPIILCLVAFTYSFRNSSAGCAPCLKLKKLVTRHNYEDWIHPYVREEHENVLSRIAGVKEYGNLSHSYTACLEDSHNFGTPQPLAADRFNNSINKLFEAAQPTVADFEEQSHASNQETAAFQHLHKHSAAKRNTYSEDVNVLCNHM